jgi:acetolactate synthase-1/2/3 large subunit
MMTEADLVVVIGAPLDFRVGYGRFGDATVAHIVDSRTALSSHAAPRYSVSGDLTATLCHLSAAGVGGPHTGHIARRERWVNELRQYEDRARTESKAILELDDNPINPTRILGEIRLRLERNAIVIGDGGDFVSFAGRYLDSFEPGCWLDAGPFGCLGSGLGYAIAARLAHPARQVVLLLGDGAFGFSGMDIDTLVRHQLPIVGVISNNAAFGLDKHTMRHFYGYDVGNDLQPECRYDLVAKALGANGELVRSCSEIGPALDRAFASGEPYFVNVLTDGSVNYPRSFWT